MNSSDSVAEIFSTDAANFNLLQLQKLFGCLEELPDDDQPIDEAVVAFEDEMLLELPSLWFLFSFEIIWKFLFELPERGSEGVEDLQRHDHLVQGFFDFNLKRTIDGKRLNSVVIMMILVI